MPSIRRAIAMMLVVGFAVGCSAIGTPSPNPVVAPTGTTQPLPSPSEASSKAGPSSTVRPLPPHEVVRGPDVAGAFDLATDGTVIVWSAGTIDADAPDLWSLDPSTGQARPIFRSQNRRAILANIAVRNGTYAFAEVTPRSDGSRTWQLILLRDGQAHSLDVNDVPPQQTGVLPMAAISDRGVLWATSHRGDGQALRCELRYAALDDLRPRVVASQPCSATEFWYPRSDGRRFVYGTVEYRADGDERHVYLASDDGLAQPRRLDDTSEASLPAILGDTVVWKAAPKDVNMFSPGALLELDLAGSGPAHLLVFPSSALPQLTLPSLGPGFIVGEDAGGGSVTLWDRGRGSAWEIDRLSPADPGFLSGTRLAGDRLAWFYTSAAGGGGTREIRWLSLTPG